jgi:hypothetical protein
MRRFAWTVPVGLLLAGSLPAQQEFRRFTGNVGAGFTQGIGNTGARTDIGWNVDGGAGVNVNPYVGLMLQFNYNRLGINRSTLDSLGGIPGGNVSMWAATFDPVFHLAPGKPVDVYVIGGGGLYHWNQEFTAPTVATATAFDPYFGFFFPVNIPAQTVLSSYSVNKPGWNAGLGFSFGSRWGGKFYSEARFHRMEFGDRHADMLPVTFGFRW